MINALFITLSRKRGRISESIRNLRELAKRRLRIVGNDTDNIRLCISNGMVVMRFCQYGYHKTRDKPLRLIGSQSIAFIKDKLKLLNIG